jgi:beta-lactam-binding protein with PASTA domain
MFKTITHRPLWFNLLVAILLIIVFFVTFMFSLNWITKHGDSISVPSVVGKNIKEVEKLLDDKGFTMVVQDSVYYDSLPPGTVVKQIPEGDQVVKVNRTVYVLINRFVAPDISMPNLVGYSFRNAEMTLTNLGLKLGDTTYRTDFAKNSVLEQLFNGNPVKAGDKIRMGSAVSLVLGSGLGNENMKVPDLVGMTFADAKAALDAYGLIMGVAIPDPDVKDTANAFVRWQSPQPFTSDGAQIRIRPGQMVDLRLSSVPPVKDSTSQSPQIPD